MEAGANVNDEHARAANVDLSSMTDDIVTTTGYGDYSDSGVYLS